MTLNKPNLRISLGLLIFALVVQQPNTVPNGLMLKVSKNVGPTLQSVNVSWDERGVGVGV